MCAAQTGLRLLLMREAVHSCKTLRQARWPRCGLSALPISAFLQLSVILLPLFQQAEVDVRTPLSLCGTVQSRRCSAGDSKFLHVLITSSSATSAILQDSISRSRAASIQSGCRRHATIASHHPLSLVSCDSVRCHPLIRSRFVRGPWSYTHPARLCLVWAACRHPVPG